MDALIGWLILAVLMLAAVAIGRWAERSRRASERNATPDPPPPRLATPSFEDSPAGAPRPRPARPAPARARGAGEPPAVREPRGSVATISPRGSRPRRSRAGARSGCPDR